MPLRVGVISTLGASLRQTSHRWDCNTLRGQGTCCRSLCNRLHNSAARCETLPSSLRHRCAETPQSANTRAKDDDLRARRRRRAAPGRLDERATAPTLAYKNQLVSCGSGRIERVNKLASVRPVRGGTRGSVGDLVVGEIVEVAHRSWKVDVGSTRKATLAITSVDFTRRRPTR